MNNTSPFFNPFGGFQNYELINNYEKLINKIDRLEKNLRILETRINKLERIDNKQAILEEPSDMYMI